MNEKRASAGNMHIEQGEQELNEKQKGQNNRKTSRRREKEKMQKEYNNIEAL